MLATNLKHTAILFSFLIFLPAAVLAQRATVSGTITNEKKKAQESVNISVVGYPGGETTDLSGKYSISVPANTDIEVAISFVGYQTSRHKFNLKDGQNVTLNFQLQKSIEELPGVEISTEQKEDINFIKINPKLIKQIPNASGSFEAIIKTLPGVASANELSSTYNVRGGNYDENLVYVNDVEIYRPFLVRAGQQEGLSFINSDLVDNINFSAGGFNATYGDKLSSVLDIKYRKPEEFGGSIGLSLLGGNFHLEGTSKNKRFTYLGGVRARSNQYVLNTLDTEGEYTPFFLDVQGYLTYNITEKSELAFLGSYSQNRFQIVPENRETEFGTVNEALKLTIFFDGQEIDNYQTSLGALSYTTLVNDNLKLKFIGSGYQTFETESFDIQGQYFLDELERDLGSDEFGEVLFNRGVGGFIDHARNELQAYVFNGEHKGYYTTEKGQWQWGFKFQHEIIEDEINEWDYLDSADFSVPRNPANEITLQQVVNTEINLNSNRYSAYLQKSWNMLSDDSTEIQLSIGGRTQFWDLNEQTIFSPRGNVSIKPKWDKNWSFRAATGIYYQPPFYRELRDWQGNLNRNLQAQRSIHFVAGADHIFESWGREFKFTTEVYYKLLDNMVPYKIDNLRLRYFANNGSHGYAAGVDFRVNGQFVPGIESWASLSLLKTEENIAGDSYYRYFNSDGVEIIPGFTVNDVAVDSTLQEPGLIARPTDQRVTFSLFFQDYLPNNPSFRMNLNLIFGTGLPFGPPNSERWEDTFRIPPYRRVDVGFAKQIIDPEQKKDFRFKTFNHIKSFWITLEVFNLLQVNNVASYLWIRDVNNRQYAVPNFLTARQVNLKLNMEF